MKGRKQYLGMLGMLLKTQVRCIESFIINFEIYVYYSTVDPIRFIKCLKLLFFIELDVLIKRLFRKLVLSLKNSLIEQYNLGGMLTKYEHSSSTQKLNTEIEVIPYFVKQLMLSLGIYYYANLRICSNINVTGFCSQSRPLDLINLCIVTLRFRNVCKSYSSKNNSRGAAIRNILTLLFTLNQTICLQTFLASIFFLKIRIASKMFLYHSAYLLSKCKCPNEVALKITNVE
ncbi:hypothetical protein T4D_9454 [Trichinella pseudospiralis]|uniref:Uncharacterized protein n=1 Tax=Trichinella pseudospiralis TaxID=6337 RepID=A0A0V1FTJ4_TRIPS|nr:hypothetical protein T4D_9454 [Trichinella pseudospiralis]